MSIARFATRRRVTVAMILVTLMLFGMVSFGDLKVNLLPDLSYPTLTIRTEYVGAAPAEIENLLSQPIEEALGVVQGVTSVKSISRAGQSDVILEFSWGTDMGLAALNVREKLEILRLPKEATRPLLLRFNPATDPIMRLALVDNSEKEGFSEARLKTLRRFADDFLKKRLEPVVGVAAVKVSGGLEDEIQIDVDQGRLARLNLTIEDISNRLRKENVNLSGGSLNDGDQRFLVRTVNQFRDLDEMQGLVISTADKRPVYLRDIASVTHGFKERQAIIRVDGKEAVEVALYKEGDANTVAVSNAIKAEIKFQEKRVPESMQLRVIDDQSSFIRASIDQVVNAAAIGGLLAVLIVYFFLGDAIATLIISVTIPISVVATFFLMDQASIGLNIMSLGGIALAVGLLVDNAIVVLENIHRKQKEGLAAIEAAIQGTTEVSGAIVASTLTTVAVFLPLVFVQGIAGQLFHDQALTVAFALVVSLGVALIAIPMMASLKARKPLDFPEPRVVTELRQRNAFVRAVKGFFRAVFVTAPAALLFAIRWILRLLGKLVWYVLRPPTWLVSTLFQKLERGYGRTLPWALKHPALILLFAAGSFGGAVMLIPHLGVDLIPQMAQGQFNVKLKLPPGAGLQRTDEAVKRLQSQANLSGNVDLVFAVSGSGNRLDANPSEAGENIGNMLVKLKAGSDDSTEASVKAKLRETVRTVASLQAEFSRPELFSFSTPLEIEFVGYDLQKLKTVADEVVSLLSASDRLVDVKSNLAQGHPEIQIRFDQEKAAAYGLTVKEISSRVVAKVRGEIATRYAWRDKKIDVLVRASVDNRSSIADLKGLIINPGSDYPVTLDSVATLVASAGPAEIRRTDQERVAVISADLAYGDLGTAIAEVSSILESAQIPANIRHRIAGQNKEMEASFGSLKFALTLAVFLVYLVMASQFESLVHPFVILFSIPLALVGAVAALWITGTTINIVVFIGLIMLAGIVVNNAIVLVDLINKLRAKGSETKAAILEAGQSRLRPIAMTTLTTCLGLLPLAIGSGDGAEVRAPMAITVIGGLLISTLLTLVVVPVMYSLLARAPRMSPEASVAGAAVEGAA